MEVGVDCAGIGIEGVIGFVIQRDGLFCRLAALYHAQVSGFGLAFRMQTMTV